MWSKTFSHRRFVIALVTAGSLLLGQDSIAGDYEKALDQAEKLFDKGDLDAVIARLNPWVERLHDAKEAYHGLGLRGQ